MTLTGEVSGRTATEAVVQAVDMHKKFGDRVAVDGISLHILPGETYGLLGPNGAGKSTLIAMIAGLRQPDAGHAVIAGHRVSAGATEAKQHIGLVPQEIAIYPDLTAEENLNFFATLQGMSRADRTRRVSEVLELIGLADRRKERTDTFSGGMKRRLNIGIGLLHRPQVLILDEPTVGVDPQSRNAILESIEALSVEGMAVLYTTHYMEEAARLCDRIGILDNGRLLAEGTTDSLTAMLEQQETIVIGLEGPVGGAPSATVIERLKALEGTGVVDADGPALRIGVDRASARLSAVIDAVTAAGGTIASVEVERADLEAVFLHLTGKGLRD